MKEIESDRYCSIIEDLLPLYVEDLVSSDTKKEIENHIKKCEKCAKVLNTIRKDGAFDLEESNEENNTETREKEINCIKNIKKKIAFKVIISIIITCIIFVVGINLWNTYRFIQDEDGKWILYNFKTGNIKQGMDYTHIVMEYTGYKAGLKENEILNGGNQETVEHCIIFTFNEKDICVNARQIISGYDNEELQDVYKWYEKNWEDITTNIKVENGKLYMNESKYVGKTKERIIKNSEDYNAKIIEF